MLTRSATFRTSCMATMLAREVRLTAIRSKDLRRAPRVAALYASACAGALLSGLLAFAGSAAAQDECGTATGGQAACAPGAYPTGISYATTNPFALTLLQNVDTAVSTTTGGVQVSTVGDGLTSLLRGLTGSPETSATGPSLINLAGDGVRLSSTGGDVLIDLRDPGTGSSFTVSGSASGIVAAPGGQGGASVLLGAGSVEGQSGNGVEVIANGPITIDTGAAAITAANDGIHVIQSGADGAVTISTGGPISGIGDQPAQSGIFVGGSDATNTAPITVSVGGSITQVISGVRVVSPGSRDVSVSTGPGAAIVAQEDAINIATAGTGSITVSTGTDVVADSNRGSVGIALNLSSDQGAINITTAQGTTISAGLSPNVIKAVSSGGDINIANGAALVGENGTGISAVTDTGSISVVSTGAIGSGALPVSVDGILASVTSGSGQLSVQTSGDIFATGAAGVLASNSGSGAVNLTLGAGTITASRGDGLNSTTVDGANTIDISGSIVASIRFGVEALSQAGPIDITVRSGASVTGAAGIVAQGTGAISITNAGQVAGTGGHGVQVATLGEGATLTNSAGGTLSGAGSSVNGSTVFLGGNGDLALENSGTITTAVADHLGLVYADTGIGTTNLTNAAGGVIDGRISSVRGGGVVFSNAGTWLTNGASVFGSADNAAGRSVINTGTIQAGAPQGATLVSQTTFSAIGMLQNQGLVSLSNGLAGDNLSLSGGYSGAGASALSLDITTKSGAVADTLTLAGTATGSTVVRLTSQGPLGVTNGTLLVQAATGSSPTAFVLAPEFANQGLLHNFIVYNPTTGAYVLQSAPNATATEFIKFAEMRHTLWRATASGWSTHMEQLRDSEGPAVEGVSTGVYAWGQILGGGRSLKQSQTLAFGGVSVPVDQGYDQSYVGGQVGFELLQQLFQGSAVLGLTAGYVDGSASFSATNDKLSLSQGNVGAYANYANSAFYVNGLIKVDLGSLHINSGLLGINRSLNTRQFGLSVEVGHRFGGEGWFVEPQVSGSYIRGFVAHNGADQQLNTLDLFNVSVVYPDDTSVRARLGVRAGLDNATAFGVPFRPYAGLGVDHEFGQDSSVSFNSPGAAIVLHNLPVRTFGDAHVGATFSVAPRLTFAIEADTEFAGGLTGGSGRAAVVYHW